MVPSCSPGTGTLLEGYHQPASGSAPLAAGAVVVHPPCGSMSWRIPLRQTPKYISIHYPARLAQILRRLPRSSQCKLRIYRRLCAEKRGLMRRKRSIMRYTAEPPHNAHREVLDVERKVLFTGDIAAVRGRCLGVTRWFGRPFKVGRCSSESHKERNRRRYDKSGDDACCFIVSA
jgi:hypothetical protein